MITRKPLIPVINDDTHFLQLMHDLLDEEEAGDTVAIRKEADQAYEFVKKTRPDLGILDIRVGHEENGWMLLELLTAIP